MEILISLVDQLLLLSSKMGYFGVFFLMAIESSFIPFPSEIVVPPAAYLAQQGEMRLSIVILAGIGGSLVGASFNYFLGMTLGRKMIYGLAGKRFSRFLLIDEKKISRAEDYFLRYGGVSTFFGRLIPAVRQLISIPAGFSKMSYKKFVFYTFLGSGLWTVILAFMGYTFGSNKELFHHFYKEISIFLAILSVLAIAFILLRKRTVKKQEA
jgi:membrane protein DedA with SNARE-associated domain